LYGNKILLNQGNKYRVYPTEGQQGKIAQMEGNNRWLWNRLLELNIECHKVMGRYLSESEMSSLLPIFKEEHSWLKDSYSQALQQVCIQLRRALDDYLDSSKGFPNFKVRGYSESGISFPKHWKLGNKSLRLPILGEIAWVYHREINGKPKNVTLTQDLDRYYVSVCSEYSEPSPVVSDLSEDCLIDLLTRKRITALDVGIVRLATDSNGQVYFKVEFPKLDKRIKALQKFLSKHSVLYGAKTLAERRAIIKKLKSGKIKQSSKYSKAKAFLAKLQRLRRNKREDALHKVSSTIVNSSDVIVVEDLNVRNMTKAPKKHEDGTPRKGVAAKAGLNREILSQAWGLLFMMLAYKAKRQGKLFIKVDPAFTSQTCSVCGHVNHLNRESQAVFRCRDCGADFNADFNASRNILNRGINYLLNEDISLLLGADKIKVRKKFKSCST
jgi:putative transposase